MADRPRTQYLKGRHNIIQSLFVLFKTFLFATMGTENSSQITELPNKRKKTQNIGKTRQKENK